jgi:hypothetical protein
VDRLPVDPASAHPVDRRPVDPHPVDRRPVDPALAPPGDRLPGARRRVPPVDRMDRLPADPLPVRQADPTDRLRGPWVPRAAP